jgi:hypothetical protein
MNLEFAHKNLPRGAVKCRYESEMYRLKYRKKMLYEDNRELFIGLRYLLWSRYSRMYYERVIDNETLPENLAWYIRAGWLFIWPTSDNKDLIREDTNKANLGWRQILETILQKRKEQV